MNWKTKLLYPIPLKSGVTLNTLEDCRLQIAKLPVLHARQLHWQYTSAYLHCAAKSGGTVDIMVAMVELRRALEADGIETMNVFSMARAA